MEINKKGSSRIIIVIPSLGIVLKIARCNPLKAIRVILMALSLWPNDLGEGRALSLRAWLRRRKYYFKCGVFGPPKLRLVRSFSYLFLRGIIANMSEFIFYLANTDNKFLIPTYFSLFGIINIQPLQQNVCTSKYNTYVFEHLEQFTEANELFEHNAHAFAEGSNFCLNEEGKLCILDYAGRGTQKIVKKYGQKWNSKLERAD